MKAAAFTYHVPRTVAEVCALLGQLENARVLGGGQSLMPMLNLRVAAPDHLIDLGHIENLVGIDDRETVVAIGAMTTQRTLERSDIVRRHLPLLAQAVDHVGHQQTRNRGTLGGSICHLDPGAELPVAAAALEAVLIAEGESGRRRIPFAEFAVGYLTNALQEDEILVELEFPKTPPRSGSAFMEFNLRPADFAIVSVATQLSLDRQGRIERIAIAVGGIRQTPVRLDRVERMLTGRASAPEHLSTAVLSLAGTQIDGDEVYTPEFRREVCGVLLERALKVAVEHAVQS